MENREKEHWVLLLSVCERKIKFWASESELVDESDTLIFIHKDLDRLIVSNCANCVIFAPAIVHSVQVRSSSNIALLCVAQQVRISRSSNLLVYGESVTRTTSDDCEGILIVPNRAKNNKIAALLDLSRPFDQNVQCTCILEADIRAIFEPVEAEILNKLNENGQIMIKSIFNKSIN